MIKQRKKLAPYLARNPWIPAVPLLPFRKWVGAFFVFLFFSLVLQRISSELRLVAGYLPVISVCSLSSPAPSPQDPLNVSKIGKKKEITPTTTVLERNITLPESSQKKSWQCPHLLLTHPPLVAVLSGPGCRQQLRPPPRGLCLASIVLLLVCMCVCVLTNTPNTY